jgi:eukaryotic-like serine/threonine-protein kinase
VAFAEGVLAPDALARVESHAVACAQCQDLLAAAIATGALKRPRPAGATVPFAEQSLSRGDQLGRYTILAPIGRGAMGEVYAAYDDHLDRKVAVKLLRVGTGPRSASAETRLIREARALAKVSHPNVVAVHDAGTLKGRVYLAMDYVDGTTVSEWLAERPRGRQEILTVFVSAARGLAAAHAAGLVHRDFKPSNVMIARDGTVRVADFGLARLEGATAEDGDPPHDPAPSRNPRVTQTGELLGTPLFMAPEQFRGRAADARTDQFSFCVSLYRALYGASPFRFDTIEVLRGNVLAGRIQPRPPHSAIPSWLRQVLIRGLAVEPDSRWPTMAELLKALERDPARIRRRWALLAGTAAIAALSLAAVSRADRSTALLCLGGPGRLAGVWEDAGTTPAPRRKAIERAFEASGAVGRAEVWNRVSDWLNHYRARWLAMYRDACEATHVRNEQTAALLDLRMTCLEDRRRSFSALTDVLITADRDVVDSAVDAATALPPLERCADREALETLVEQPRDVDTGKRVDEIRARVAVAKALDDTGKHEQAREALRALLGQARSIGYRPLIAEVLLANGHTFVDSLFSKDALALYDEAVWTSLAIGRDDLAAEAAIMHVASVGAILAEHEEGHAWAKLADALLERAGEHHEILRSWLLQNEAVIADQQHHTQEALELTKRAVALKDKVLPPDHPDRALSLNTEANILVELNRSNEALKLLGRVYDIFVRAYGPSSTEAAVALNNQSESLIALGRPAEALTLARQSEVIWKAHIGSRHPFLGYPLTALGRALVALARPEEAIAPLERALRLREAGEHDPSMIAETRFALARALWDSHLERNRAVSLAKQARQGCIQAGDATRAAEVDAWFAGHAIPNRRWH